MTPTLHHCHEARSMRPRWLLNELGLDFELVVLRSPEDQAVHPLGRVPCLVDDDLVFFEKTLEVVDEHLKGREYLLMSGFGAADIAVGYSLHLARAWRALETFPRVEAYYRRVRARPAFQASLPPADDLSPLEGRSA